MDYTLLYCYRKLILRYFIAQYSHHSQKKIKFADESIVSQEKEAREAH